MDNANADRDGVGPRVRTDVIDVYIFRRVEHRVEFLQLRRVGEPLSCTWQPVMGHVHGRETAVETAIRELHEEVGIDLRAGPAVATDTPGALGLWALDQVHPFFIARLNVIVMSPRFACEVAAPWEPTLNAEHDAARWVDTQDVPWAFMWPGQMGAIDEILRCIVPEESLSREHLRVV